MLVDEGKLHHFQKMVMAQVTQLGGPKDWALPYWTWDAPDGDGRLPTAFRNPTLTTADGVETNYLYHCNIDRLWEVWIQRKPGNKNRRFPRISRDRLQTGPTDANG